MTEPETLTAEERAHAGEYPGLLVAKLLRLYDAALTETKREQLVLKDWAEACIRARGERDAALVRAEAAEAKLALVGCLEANALATMVIGLRAEIVQCRREHTEQFEAKHAAESALASAQARILELESYSQALAKNTDALAEATALLKRCDEDDIVNYDLRDEVVAFLSRTPAPAAKAEPDEDKGAIIRACGLLARAWESESDPRNTELGVVPDVAREMSVAAAREHDALRGALRECRAELERYATALGATETASESARAERDTARADLDRIRARAMQDADRELEALTVSRALVERIEAELEKVSCCMPAGAVDNVLTLIRASKAGGA